MAQAAPTRILALSGGRASRILWALLAANGGVWVWAWLAFHAHPALLGMALVAWSLGLRHAVDADHIAAIDNVTRNMMQSGKQPVMVGFFFSLGHSSVVVLVTLAIALATNIMHGWFDALKDVGEIIGTSVSATLLFVVAIANLFALRDTYRQLLYLRPGESNRAGEHDLKMRAVGMGRFLTPLLAMIRRSWQMFPVGFLFGLGFDTATEISLLGLAATEASKGLPLIAVMVFPALFTVGMALIDTVDNMLMLGAYQWAFVNPARKLYYNLTVTSVSICVALFVGGVEVAGLVTQRLKLHGGVWDMMSAMNLKLDVAGYLIVGIFAVIWMTSVLLHRWRDSGAAKSLKI